MPVCIQNPEHEETMNRACMIALALAVWLPACRTSPEAPFPAAEGEGDRPARTVKVAVCQIICLDGDRSGNLARIDAALAEARAAGAEIACFPETALYGWVNPAAHERAQPIPGGDTDALAALALKHGIWICTGLAEKEGGKLYDSAVLIDGEGSIVLTHRKINILTKLMDPPYTPGSDVEIAETPFGRIGILICADSFKKEILDRMAALEPDLVIIPYGWAAPEDWWPDHGKALEKTVSAAAEVIGAPVVATDLVGSISSGPWRNYVYGGQSLVADGTGKVLATCRDRDREIMVLSIE
jgi:N-carbamoylputrescine amidase